MSNRSGSAASAFQDRCWACGGWGGLKTRAKARLTIRTKWHCQYRQAEPRGFVGKWNRIYIIDV